MKKVEHVMLRKKRKLNIKYLKKLNWKNYGKHNKNIKKYI